MRIREERAMEKYMYVGHVFVVLDQAVRDRVPVGVCTVWNVFRVLKNLWRVRDMGIRTAREIIVARMRDRRRRVRMRYLRS